MQLGPKNRGIPKVKQQAEIAKRKLMPSMKLGTGHNGKDKEAQGKMSWRKLSKQKQM